MAIPSSRKEGKSFEKCPEGTHICRCVTICDIGLQETQWGDKEQVYLGFEVTDFDVEWTDKDGVERKGLGLIGATWTNNLYEEANLGMNLISWRGRPFTDEEAAEFDLSRLLGIPCMISVVHNTNKQGKVYANIASIMGIPKGVAVPDQVTPSVGYSAKDPSTAGELEKLPEWLQKKVAEAKEPEVQTENLAPHGHVDHDDFEDLDIPF